MTRNDAPVAVRLDVLGTASVRRDGEPLADVLAQPKRFALLVYIALRRPDAVVSRDELLGVFWPESTERRARAALRQGLHFLRGHLGDDVIVNRGDTGVRLDPDRAACDGVEFLRAIDAGAEAAAIDVYGGELLPGFVLAGAYEFDRWLHAERQKLRASAIRAALRVARADADRGEPELAADRVRWALQLEPTDEAVARELIALLAEAGNRAAAVAVYDTLEERLADDLELEPSPETRELIAAVRSPDATARPTPGRTPGSATDLSPHRILVLALENVEADAELAAVGRLAADAVAQGLSTIPDLEVVPPMAIGGAEPARRPARGELVRRTGAGTVVDGSYYAEDDQLHLHARITDVVRDTLMESPEPVIGPAASPLDAIEELRDRVMTILAPALTRRAVHVKEAVRPPSMAAYTAYLDGLDRFIRGDWAAALERFNESAAMEPDYALPRIVGAITLWNLGALEEARATALEASRLRSSLGRFEHAVLDTVLAWLDGDWAAAHRAVEIQAELAPGSIPHFQVAEEARRLNRPRATREVLATLDPEAGEMKGWIFYWIELTAAHHLMGDHVRELELASRCRGLHPDDPIAALLEIRALAALGRDEAVTRIIDRALAAPAGREPTPGALLREAALELRAHGAHGPDGTGGTDGPGADDGADIVATLLDRAVDWYRERVDEAPTDAVRRDLARTLYHAGSLTEARRIFTDLVTPGAGVQPVGHHHGQLQAHLDQGYLVVIAARQGDEDEIERWRRELETLDRPFLYGAPRFWLAALAAVEGRADDAVRQLRRAFADGLPHELFVHSDPHLLRLRGYEPFDALVRPRA